MSLTDDTNTQNSNTIDIPLPDERHSSLGSNASPDSLSMANHVTSSWSQPTADAQPEHNVMTSASTVTPMPNNTNCYINSTLINGNTFDASLQQSYQNYYSYYSSAYQQMPQMMPQNYQYFIPLMRPMIPVVAHMPSIPVQSQTVVNNKTNNKYNNKQNNEIEDNYDDEDDEDSDPTVARKGTTRASNVLPIHCNEKMGLNPLIYTNIQQSPYFKNNLFQLKTYHEVIDEIFYSVKHLEPWEKGSRKVGGQTGMCGSVRGVGAGGIISTPFCILFKLFTLKLTRKQVNGLIRHKDSSYIRALGFMYIRFTQPPQHLFKWFEPFLEDEEELDPKAGGGQPMTIGQMVRHMLTKLDWFSTLFPRVPVPIQKEIESQLKRRDEEYEQQMREERGIEDGEVEDEEEEEQEVRRDDSRGRHVRRRSADRESASRHSRDRKRSRDRDRRSRSRDDKSSRSNEKHRHRRSGSPHTHRYNRGDNRSDNKSEHKHKRY